MAKKEEIHPVLKRFNNRDNPIVLESATLIRQPKLIPFNFMLELNSTQAKVLIRIIHKLQDPIQRVIENRKFNNNAPLQLPLFSEDNNSSTIQLDFLLSEFGIDNTNYRKLKQDIVNMQNFLVANDTLYYNSLMDATLEAKEIMPLLARVILPKKYEKYISIKLEKEVANLLIDVTKSGYTRYLLEIATRSGSKYTLMMYLLISSWRDKGGFSLTIEKFKKAFRIEDKYPTWGEVNSKVLKKAYKELHESADIWFEYDMIRDNQGKPYKINFKIVSGYYKVASTDEITSFPEMDDVCYIMEYHSLNTNQKNCYHILTEQLLLNEEGVVGEIIYSRLEDFYKWWEVYKTKLNKLKNPAAYLLTYLKMTAKFNWKQQKWKINKNLSSPKLNTSSVIPNQEYIKLWESAYEKLTSMYDKTVCETWFKPIAITEVSNNNVLLKVPSEFFAEFVYNKYGNTIKSIFEEILKGKFSIQYKY